ncbi:SRPBCC family protein [Actinoplanes couchii]|uniref:Cyclase n=1 Tax=Actinoplanes couchii TaxID=403638 RepID=A0ABQ3XG11_9ACTN|nr:SRPBCC family protein [Actinoplanes couchii]MDR6320909.1 uncharacterized protein YndB with AHSA1/START domain [Actinoplanes couchii]GID57421.1 cyclase [Actinoplanes couchii]
MDLVTGAGVTVELVVPMPRERMWELVTAVERIGEWSPEAIGADWCDGVREPAVGARFAGRSRFPDGFEGGGTCVVTDVRDREVFAWDVLDDDGLAGSSWRYELADGNESGTTVVRQRFRHGPGITGARLAGGFGGRIVALCSNMVATITAMEGAR